MKYILFCFALLLYLNFADAQTIKGKVYRGASDTVVAGAVVYYGGSVVGTIADERGNFELAAKPQQIPVIVSCVGYYSATVNYEQGKLLVVRLQPKNDVLKTVTVRAKSLSSSAILDRKAEEKLFIQEFLGISIFAKSCTILNINDIDFSYEQGTLTASCDKPIIIRNKKLGYTINYYLDNFSRTLNNTHYAGNSIFKEDTTATLAEKADIIYNREAAYVGSRMRFTRALWYKNLHKAGFTITGPKDEPITVSSILMTDSMQHKYLHFGKSISVYLDTDPNNRNILFSSKPYLFIDKNGFCEQGLQWTGRMSDQRVGDQLPYEYRSKYDTLENSSPSETNANVITKPATIAVKANDKLPGDTSVTVFFEKVYLHTDRDTYAQGEDIWFKAYLLDAQTNKQINYSKNLYVELINPSAKVVSRKMMRLENGLTNGDFKLADTLTTGNYRLRAYTNWMRNFGDNFIFEKNVRIIADVLANADAKVPMVKGKALNVKALPKINPDTLPLVRFFPEGGSMVNGLSAVIAVKAEDENGHGLPAKGAILNNQGETVTSFVCDSAGFGAFTLLPDAAQHYQAMVNVRRKDRRYVLPDVTANGFNMHVQDKQRQLNIAISCTDAIFDKNNGQQMYLVAKHAGKTFAKQTLLLTDKAFLIKIPDDMLAAGVNAITLSDAKNQPLCERLIYISHDKNIQLGINTDKPAYPPKEQTTVHLKLNKPDVAHLSLAAVDAQTVPVQPENIVSYLELQSEVRGHIEQAAKYFDTANVNRFKQLDLLLLTQGWRNFVWKRLEDTTIKFDHEVEQGITITGVVTKTSGNKVLPNIHIMLHAPKAEGSKFFETNTDTAGRFAIYGPVFYGYQYLNLSSRNYDDKNKGKSNSGGWIKVDSLNRDVLPVNAVNNFVSDTVPSTEEMMMRLKVPKKQQLKEVKIMASIKYIPEIHTITLADQKDYGTVLQYLLYNIPGAHYNADEQELKDGNIIHIHVVKPAPHEPPWITKFGLRINVSSTYSDGSRIDPLIFKKQDPLAMNITDVIAITITKFVDMGGYLTYRASVAFRPGAFAMKDYFDNTTANMIGYYKARIFYMPKFGSIDDTTDPRTTTTYWQPNIVTDKNGEATITYYNTAQKNNIRLVIQGVTDSGEPVYQTFGYSVK